MVPSRSQWTRCFSVQKCVVHKEQCYTKNTARLPQICICTASFLIQWITAGLYVFQHYLSICADICVFQDSLLSILDIKHLCDFSQNQSLYASAPLPCASVPGAGCVSEPEERVMYDHVIVSIVRMFMLQKKEQIAGFNNSQEVDTFIFVQSRFKSSLVFLRRGYRVQF